MKFIGTVVCIDLYYKAGVIIDKRGHKFVFKQDDCDNRSLPNLNSTVFFEREETDLINIARQIEPKKKAS